MQNSRASIFIPDPTVSHFARTVFIGKEHDFLLLTVLTYSVCDLWFNNTFLSLFLTYGLDFLICTYIEMKGNANIASKAMVDERFLI
jgi:hypothetical protein